MLKRFSIIVVHFCCSLYGGDDLENPLTRPPSFRLGGGEKLPPLRSPLTMSISPKSPKTPGLEVGSASRNLRGKWWGARYILRLLR